ncbi:hypothetical protein ZWY2020_050886 [Hordeum vulgare]|nr:hypothetical protein ZWY2020_050886 [Hordeum vulgare]
MYPLPAASDGTESVPDAHGATSVRDVVSGSARGPSSQRTSCICDSQKLIDLRGLVGLVDVARSPSVSCSVLQRQQLPPPRWSLRDSLSDALFEIFAIYAHFPFIGEVWVYNGMFTQMIYKSKSVDAFNSSKAQWEIEHPGSKHVFRMELPLTGPSSYIAAVSGVLLELKIGATENEPEEEYDEVVDWCHIHKGGFSYTSFDTPRFISFGRNEMK